MEAENPAVRWLWLGLGCGHGRCREGDGSENSSGRAWPSNGPRSQFRRLESARLGVGGGGDRGGGLPLLNTDDPETFFDTVKPTSSLQLEFQLPKLIAISPVHLY